jgi:hypothetical protein
MPWGVPPAGRLFLFFLRGNADNGDRGILDDLFGDAAEGEITFFPTGGHNHHVYIVLVDEIKDLPGGIPDVDVTDVQGASLEIFAADLFEPFVGGFLSPFDQLVDAVFVKNAIPGFVMGRIFDDIEYINFNVIFLN